MARKVDTDLALHHKRIQLEHLRKQHTSFLERKRYMKALNATIAYRDAQTQHATLLEASRKLPVALQRHYHNELADLSERMSGIRSKYQIESIQ